VSVPKAPTPVREDGATFGKSSWHMQFCGPCDETTHHRLGVCIYCKTPRPVVVAPTGHWIGGKRKKVVEVEV
jgi:hypothetical protein